MLGQHVIGTRLPNQAWAVAPACLGTLHRAVTVRAAKERGPKTFYLDEAQNTFNFGMSKFMKIAARPKFSGYVD